MMKAILKRESRGDKQTLGTLELFNKEGDKIFSCYTLELAWKNNERQVSCIPEGIYPVIPRVSDKFKKHYHLLNTEPRSYILIHTGNFYTQLQGCILVGSALADINGDGLLDVTSSRKTLDKLLDLAPEGFELTIE